MRRALLFAVFAAAACRFDQRLEQYCQRTQACVCDTGSCCVPGGKACGEAPCCVGVCPASGICEGDAGTGGGFAGGSGGAPAGGGNGGGPAGGSGGGGTAGGSGGGGTAGGTDAGIFGLAVPYCQPTRAPGTAGYLTACCRDYECASGQCRGFPDAGGRTCTNGGVVGPGSFCGDETDCDTSVMAACDLIHGTGRCVTSFVGTIGEGNACVVQVPSSELHGCTFMPQGTCGLPGSLTGPTAGRFNGPCCYDRFIDGGLADCRASLRDGGLGTGSCSCDDAGACVAKYDYVCPL